MKPVWAVLRVPDSGSDPRWNQILNCSSNCMRVDSTWRLLETVRRRKEKTKEKNHEGRMGR